MSFITNLLILLLLSFGVTVYGQDKYAISGRVKDDKWQILPGATVFLTGTEIITACNNSGELRFCLKAIWLGSRLQT
jgi:hypothetical protein